MIGWWGAWGVRCRRRQAGDWLLPWPLRWVRPRVVGVSGQRQIRAPGGEKWVSQRRALSPRQIGVGGVAALDAPRKRAARRLRGTHYLDHPPCSGGILHSRPGLRSVKVLNPDFRILLGSYLLHYFGILDQDESNLVATDPHTHNPLGDPRIRDGRQQTLVFRRPPRRLCTRVQRGGNLFKEGHAEKQVPLDLRDVASLFALVLQAATATATAACSPDERQQHQQQRECKMPNPPSTGGSAGDSTSRYEDTEDRCCDCSVLPR